MKAFVILILVSILGAVTLFNTESRELALRTEKVECRNCLVKFHDDGLSVVHFYDAEKMKLLKRLQSLGYMQGSDDYAAQLLIPYTFSRPEILIKMMVSSMTKYVEGTEYVVIALMDESGRTIAKEQMAPERYNTIIKDKGILTAKLKTLGRKNGSIAIKFVGIKYIKISMIEIE